MLIIHHIYNYQTKKMDKEVINQLYRDDPSITSKDEISNIISNSINGIDVKNEFKKTNQWRSEIVLRELDKFRESIIKNKPLDELSEVSLNELADNSIAVLTPIYNLIKEHITLIGIGLSLFTTLFMYKSVVKLFESLAFREEPENISIEDLIKFRQMRAREIKTFMVFGVPIIVASLWSIQTITAPSILNTKSLTEGKEITKDSVKYTSLIPFFTNKQLPNWLKLVILLIISIICINFIIKYTGINQSNNNIFIVLPYLVYIKLFFIFGSISSFILIWYYIFSLYLFIMFSKEKLSIPIYLPLFILDWLKSIQEISKSELKGLYIEFYLRLILIYILVLVLVLFILYKLFIL